MTTSMVINHKPTPLPTRRQSRQPTRTSTAPNAASTTAMPQTLAVSASSFASVPNWARPFFEQIE
jgi:hypothetical protein